MKFIKLTSVTTGSSETVPVFINPALVTTVRQTGHDTLIDFSSGYGVRVSETPEQVVEMMRDRISAGMGIYGSGTL